jgi:hypothetical protein
MNIAIKQCSKCKEEKSLDSFYNDKLTRSGKSSQCKICRNKVSKKYRIKNKDKRSAYQKTYFEKNKTNIMSRKKHTQKSYYIRNKEKIQEYQKEYHQKNKTVIRNKVRQKVNLYKKQRRKIDLNYKLTENLRSRIRKAIKIKGINQSKKSIEIIGCSSNELRFYLEKQFTDGMSWENYGFHGWHIDHIIPLSSAKNEEELIQLCHYTNLQPLWAKDNFSKGGR